jgi:hypothetical protein
MLAVAGVVSIPALACTTAIISAEASGTGRPMLWKHRDTDEYYNHIGYLKGEKYGFTALLNTRDTVYTEVWAGVNEKGFAIANNVSYNINLVPYDNPSRNGNVMMDALGVCATVDEFEQFLKDMAVPRGARANFAVIDAVGGAAYFEVGDDRYFRFDVKDSKRGYLYRTNFSFKGREDEGAGYIRYAAAEKLFEEKKRNFTPDWLVSVPARSFYHGLMKRDLKDYSDKELGEGFIISQDYIPRPTTVSSLVIEGVNPGEDPRNTVMWSAIGYAPCSYVIPVWVGAEDEIPACLSSKDKALAPANDLAMQLKGVVFPITRGNGSKYLDYVTLRSDILPEVEKAEDKEIKAGEKLTRRFEKKGFDIEAVKEFNAEADKRFDAFRRKMRKVIEK